MNDQLTRQQFWRHTVIGTVAFLGFWYLARALHFAPPQFLPMPHEVIQKFIHLVHNPFAGAKLFEHMQASLHRFGMGFGLAALIGIPLGLSMGWFRLLDDLVTPIFDAVRFIAPVAWVPFAALWFGTGIGGPTLIIFAGAFPPCLINAYRGARNVEIRYLEAASMLGVGHFKTITEVLFPAAVPSIIAGLRIGAGYNDSPVNAVLRRGLRVGLAAGAVRRLGLGQCLCCKLRNGLRGGSAPWWWRGATRDQQ
jgi:NitT/TauT family transport system permease protein